MHIIDVGPIRNNPQTAYKLVFGRNVSMEKVLDSLKEIAEMREKLGLTTEQNTLDTVREAEEKLKKIKETQQ
jgi:hypothetical protein